MYRKYPKRQDHGTRGQKTHYKYIGVWRWFDSLEKRHIALEKKRFEHCVKSELKKLSIDCTDEEFENFEVRTLFINRSNTYYWWD